VPRADNVAEPINQREGNSGGHQTSPIDGLKRSRDEAPERGRIG